MDLVVPNQSSRKYPKIPPIIMIEKLMKADRSNKGVFLSLAPALKNQGGHDYSYHKTVERAVKLAGWEFFALVSKECKIALHSNWIRIFSRRPLGVFRALGDFFRILRMFKGKNKTLFFESFSTKELMAFTFACLFLRTPSHNIWLLFRYNQNMLPLKGKVHFFCAKLLEKKFGKNFTLLTDSILIQKELSARFGSTHVMPTAPIIHRKPYSWTSKPTNTKKCWWPGIYRPQKGIQEIKQLAKALNGSNYQIYAPKSAEVSYVVSIPDILTTEQYQEKMEEVDFILLPYDPKIYEKSTSGVLVEAVLAGKIPLVKAGSWLAYELTRFHLSELVLDFTSQNILQSLEKIYSSPEIRKKLSQMQQSYYEFHSSDSYAKHVQSLLYKL